MSDIHGDSWQLWKFETSDPWTKREQVPELIAYQNLIAELLDDWNDEKKAAKSRKLDESLIPIEVSDLRRECRRLLLQNEHLRKQNETLETLSLMLHFLQQRLLGAMGLSGKEKSNPNISKDTEYPESRGWFKDKYK